MENETQLEPGRVYVYAHGLVFTSACAPAALTPEQVAAAVNLQSPTGISSAWQVSASEESFADGTKNPCPCEQDPQERRHWLLEC